MTTNEPKTFTITVNERELAQICHGLMRFSEHLAHRYGDTLLNPGKGYFDNPEHVKAMYQHATALMNRLDNIKRQS
jgi:hypothetical protein